LVATVAPDDIFLLRRVTRLSAPGEFSDGEL
jgi:hypothetical protein